MSLVDKAASLAFAAFAAIEWALNDQLTEFKWSARLTWLLAALTLVLAGYFLEQREGKRPVSKEPLAPLKKSVPKPKPVREVPPSNAAPAPIANQASPSTLVDLTPPPVSVTPLSAVSFEATSQTSSRKKNPRSLIKRTTSALFSPLKRSAKSMSFRNAKSEGSRSSTPAIETSLIETKPSDLAIVADDSVNSTPGTVSVTPATSEPAYDPNALDEFGFGPKGKPPSEEFVYVIPNTWGYLGYLDEKQTQALEQMRAKNFSCIESREPNPKFVVNDETLLRFLRARKFDVDKATRMLEAHLAWRDKYLPSRLTPNDIAAVLGTGLARFGPYSKTGLIATMIKVEYFEPSKFEGDIDMFTRYVAYFFEKGLKLLPKGGDKGMLFFDMKGFTLRKHATRFSLRLIAELINIIQAHNPERLEKCILFNTPLIFSGTWALIKGLLDPVVAAKIMFVSDTKVVLEFFEADQLPVEYGGTRTAPYPIEGFAELHTAKLVTHNQASSET